MRVVTEVEKGDKGQMEFFHVDCRTPSDERGGVIQRESGICTDCSMEIPKNLMSSSVGSTLRDLLKSKFTPDDDPDAMSSVVRTVGPRKDTLGGPTGGSPDSEPI